ncbi:hypothetical protein D3C81_572230 [compost metagenome]
MSSQETMSGLQLYSPVGPELRPEWSMRLVMDVALNASTESILEAHDLQHHQFEKILLNPTFVLQVDDLRKQLEKEGATFKLKSQLQADFYLTTVHQMIMSQDTDERVKTRLIEDVVRWGGLDTPQPVGGQGALGGFQINISFSDESRQRGITIEGNSP